MAKFRIDCIGELATQFTFSPHDTRAAQLAAAEELLHSIDPGQAYPLEFIIFKITGYRPRQTARAKALLAGIALQHDLGLLVERVSESLDVHTLDVPEPVLSIDDVTEKFAVTTKTIQRWRRRGLPARRFIFPDGKRRVGFLLGSVDRYFSAHRQSVARDTNFSLVGDAERRQILAMGRRLAVGCGCCTKEISRRISRKLDRSPLIVEHTIRKHDQEYPGQAIFPHASPPLCEDDRAALLRGYRRDQTLGELAARVGRTRQAVGRVVVEEKIARLSKKKVRYIDDPLYHQDDADGVIQAIVGKEELTGTVAGESNRADRPPRDLPPYLQDLYRTPLLGPVGERALFLKYNFQKFRFAQARRRLEPMFARNRDLQRLDGLLRQATETKNQIIRANLRLVVSIARKHLGPGAGAGTASSQGGVSLMELVSEGNLTLMRAVESFDTHRGHRFSTYATLSLMKGFARSLPQMRGGGAWGGLSGVSPKRLRQLGLTRAGMGVAHLADLADSRHGSTTDRLFERDEVQSLLGRLDEREQRVLRAHFGLEAGDAPDSPHNRNAPRLTESAAATTYEQVGRRLGLSKQRVRQIERSALAKLRAMVDPASYS